jgi:hypothetical protein
MCYAWYGTGLLDLALELLTQEKSNISRLELGGAVGWDTALAIAAGVVGIPYSLHLPQGHDKYVPLPERTVYWNMLTQASHIRYYGTHTSRETLMQRNCGIVDSSHIVLAMWDTKVRGGTAHAIRYSVATDKPVFNYYHILRSRRPPYGDDRKNR